jgi:predicted transcriptional regulator
MSTTIRVDESTRARLAAIAAADHRPMTAIVNDALDALDRRRFFASMNDRYTELRDDPRQWAAIEEERAIESASLIDAAL